jgi:hypothetical protein
MKSFCEENRSSYPLPLLANLSEITQPRVGFRRNALQQRRRQARLADARFSREQHHLSFVDLRF